MVNDISSTISAATEAAEAPQAEMDDILSSIRSGVAEEGSKVGNGSADLIEAAAAADGDAEDDDVLELSEADMAPTAGDQAKPEDSNELIDLDAFAANGEAKPADPATLQAAASDLLPGAAAEVSDEFDRLLAEISQEQQQQVEASKLSKEELMAEEEPLGTDDAEALSADGAEEDAGEAGDSDLLAEEEPGDTDSGEAALAAAPQQADKGDADAMAASAAGVVKRFDLGSVDGPDGVQVTFPAEVLAMALRPMVQEWLARNLPDVVEKLVKEEISKLAQT